MPMIANIEKKMEQRFIDKIEKMVQEVRYYSNIARVYKNSADRILHINAEGTLSRMSASDYERYEMLLDNSEQARAMCRWHMTRLDKILLKYKQGNLLICGITPYPNRLYHTALKAVQCLKDIEIPQ